MKIRHPFEPIELDLPDSWVNAAGASGFSPRSGAFLAVENSEWPVEAVPVLEVTPPRRNAGIAELQQDRSISILKAMVAGVPLPAIEAFYEPGPLERLNVRDGYHRYFLSIALGFSSLPVSVRPYFNINEL